MDLRFCLDLRISRDTASLGNWTASDAKPHLLQLSEFSGNV